MIKSVIYLKLYLNLINLNLKSFKSLITILFFSIAFIAQEQRPLSELQLMNGKILKVVLTDSSGANLFFNVTLANGKARSKSLYKDQVFSIISPDGKEEVLYKYEEIIGNDFAAAAWTERGNN